MYSYNEILIGTYPLLKRVSFRMTLSDLERLSEIFSDTKHRAVRQLSFTSLHFIYPEVCKTEKKLLVIFRSFVLAALLFFSARMCAIANHLK